MGIHTTVKGKLKPKEECPVIVAGGHSSFLDSWICSVKLENETLKRNFSHFLTKYSILTFSGPACHYN